MSQASQIHWRGLCTIRLRAQGSIELDWSMAAAARADMHPFLSLGAAPPSEAGRQDLLHCPCPSAGMSALLGVPCLGCQGVLTAMLIMQQTSVVAMKAAAGCWRAHEHMMQCRE